MRLLVVILSIFTLILAGCSDDDEKSATDGGTTTADGAVADGAAADDATTADGAAATDGATADAPETDGSLPWPDTTVNQDTSPGACTPEEPGMCGDNKNFYCKEGVCTPCPANYVDCDRKEDCECFAACDGDKCM